MGSDRNIEPPSARDHLANERTLLAWMRTALTVIGLGFVIDRLALAGPAGQLEGLAGIGLVLLGGLIAVAGAYSFLRARHELVSGSYRPGVGLDMALVAGVVLGALIVAAFLLVSRPA
ncbi:MAG TPA: DUF202 domain-containing protein [Candidatus Caenarcaniphilales bacterium]|nr:DUF202 domain-containing protein [Candidatus Caenarcaniphilales bacterium]